MSCESQQTVTPSLTPTMPGLMLCLGQAGGRGGEVCVLGIFYFHEKHWGEWVTEAMERKELKWEEKKGIVWCKLFMAGKKVLRGWSEDRSGSRKETLKGNLWLLHIIFCIIFSIFNPFLFFIREWKTFRPRGECRCRLLGAESVWGDISSNKIIMNGAFGAKGEL